MSAVPQRLLVVAHGTASVEGSATTARLIAAVAAARPGVQVDLCSLDVASPRLPDALDERPTVAVPLLLSTGYHVQSDIPGAVAGRPWVRVTAHLGPDPLLADALVDRLGDVDGAATVALVAVGSSRPEAAVELATMRRLVAERLDRQVATATISTALATELAALPAPVRIAPYLLAEGIFLTTARAAVGDRDSVAEPIGVHPALVEVIWNRYDGVTNACG